MTRHREPVERLFLTVEGETFTVVRASEYDLLEERLDDYLDDYQAVMNENCANDEKHCSCVPVLRKEIDRLRSWQQDAIDRIKVYINICDHQRVTGEYMRADECVYCALDRALIEAAIRAADQPAAVLYPGCLDNDTGYHRPDVDGFCSDCSRLVAADNSPAAE